MVACALREAPHAHVYTYGSYKVQHCRTVLKAVSLWTAVLQILLIGMDNCDHRVISHIQALFLGSSNRRLGGARLGYMDAMQSHPLHAQDTLQTS